MKLDKNYVLKILKEILEIDSPTGYTHNIIKKLKSYANELGYAFEVTKKGMGVLSIDGMEMNLTIGISAHVDTLGLMVKAIKDNGRLQLIKIGGMVYPSLDSECCKIYTRDEKVYSGTIFSTIPSEHVYPESNTSVRDANTLEILLDEDVNSKEDVVKLGIENGDIIAIDTKIQVKENGYIKSRFLDDKLAVASLFGILKYWNDNNMKPRCNVKFLFSNYEEVGNGMSYLPYEFDEIIAVDMGCIGNELTGNERSVSICAKDASGPYDYELTTKLVKIAKENNIRYALDVYTSYKSDVSAAKIAGNDFKGALIGPGVFASHGYERSHYEAVENTMKLIIEYFK